MSSMFWAASCWNRNSLPARRAESPVQVAVAEHQNLTPATEQFGDGLGGLLGAILVGAGAASQNRYSKPSKLSTSLPWTGTSNSTSIDPVGAAPWRS